MTSPRRFCGRPARSRRSDVATAAPGHDAWWPWSPTVSGRASCPESTVLFDALLRRLTVTGSLRSCCVQKISRVLDFVQVVTPGDTSIDVTGVTRLDPCVALELRAWTNRLAARDLRLSVVGASPAVVRALAG